MTQSNRRETKKRILKAALFALSPIVAMGLLCLRAGKNLFLSLPMWSDELDYFREIFSFSENGFDFGGSLFVGYAAKYGPFGAHSFSPLLAWGLPSLIFPFKEHSIFIINLVLLCLAWGIFALVLNPGVKDIYLSLLLAVLYPPMAMYMFTSMIEIPLYAGLIVYSALLVRYVRKHEKRIYPILLLVGIWCIFMRMPYIVILFPAIMAREDFKVNKKTIRNLLIYVLFFLVIYKVFNLFCAGYPGWLTAQVAEAEGIRAKLYYVAVNIKRNLVMYFSFSGNLAEIVLRYAYGLTIVLMFVFSLIKVENKRVLRRQDSFLLTLFIMNGGLWAIMVCLYEIRDWKDFRTFSPILLMTFLILFLVKSGEERETAGMIERLTALMLLVMVIFMNTTVFAADREIEVHCDVVSEFENLEVTDSNGKPLTLAATFNANYGNFGDICLMRSLPSKLGYQIFYNNYVDANLLDEVDYLLASELQVEDLADRLSMMKETSYGTLYKVIK